MPMCKNSVSTFKFNNLKVFVGSSHPGAMEKKTDATLLPNPIDKAITKSLKRLPRETLLPNKRSKAESALGTSRNTISDANSLYSEPWTASSSLASSRTSLSTAISSVNYAGAHSSSASLISGLSYHSDYASSLQDVSGSEEDIDPDFVLDSDDDFDINSSPDSSDSSEIQWSSCSDFDPLTLPFTGSPGLPLLRLSNASPFELLMTFLDREILDFITYEANQYAWQKGLTHSQPLTREGRPWTDLTIDELLLFIGVILYMGVVRLDNIRDYWSSNQRFGVACIAPHMTYSRFLSITAALRFVSPTAFRNDSTKTVQSVSKLLNLLRERFPNYSPKAELWLQESIIVESDAAPQSKESLSNHSYMKLYTLRESQSGYFLNFEIDTGDDSRLQYLHSRPASESFARKNVDKVISNLLNPFEGVGHALYIRSSCLSPGLSLYLKSTAKFETVGLLKAKASLSNVFESPLKPGESDSAVGAANNTEVLAQRYADRKVTTIIISTMHSNAKISSSDGKPSLPVSLGHYRHIADNIDTLDQQLELYYLSKTIGRKHYTPFFNRILNMTVHNAFLIFSKLSPDSKYCKANLFRKAIIDEIFNSNTPRRPVRPIGFNIGHIISRIPRRAKDPSKIVRRKCRWHLTKLGKENHRTRMWCPSCKVSLCADPCFEAYHREKFVEQIQQARIAASV